MQPFLLHFPLLSATTPIQKILLRKYLVPKFPPTALNIIIADISVNGDDDWIFTPVAECIDEIFDIMTEEDDDRWFGDIFNIFYFDHISPRIDGLAFNPLIGAIENEKLD